MLLIIPLPNHSKHPIQMSKVITWAWRSSTRMMVVFSSTNRPSPEPLLPLVRRVSTCEKERQGRRHNQSLITHIYQKGSSWDKEKNLFLFIPKFLRFPSKCPTPPPTCCVRFPNFCTIPSTLAGWFPVSFLWWKRGENLPLSFPNLLAFCTLQLVQAMRKLGLSENQMLVGWSVGRSVGRLVGWFRFNHC